MESPCLAGWETGLKACSRTRFSAKVPWNPQYSHFLLTWTQRTSFHPQTGKPFSRLRNPSISSSASVAVLLGFCQTGQPKGHPDGLLEVGHAPSLSHDFVLPWPGGRTRSLHGFQAVSEF